MSQQDQQQDQQQDHQLTNNTEAAAGQDRLTQRIQKTDDEIAINAWASLKGISIVIGKMLCNKYTIASIIMKQVPVDELKQFKTASGKIANKYAINSILCLRNGTTADACKNASKMIAAIPGITVVTAAVILKNKSLEQLCTMTISELENITIPRGTGESKLGKKASLLFNLFNYKTI